MTCDERKDLILMYAADAMDDAAERDELRAHLASGCPTCAASLAEAQATVAHLPLTLPLEQPSPSSRDRLMQRVLSGSSSLSRARFWTAIASLAAIVALTVAGSMWWSNAGYRAQLARAERANSMLRARNVELVSLAGMPPQPNATGRVLWDRDHNMWHVSVFNLKSLPPDKVYQLWFIMPDGKAMPAPTFRVDEDGSKTLAINVPKDMGVMKATGITIEDAAGATTPTMPIQLAGKVQ